MFSFGACFSSRFFHFLIICCRGSHCVSHFLQFYRRNCQIFHFKFVSGEPFQALLVIYLFPEISASGCQKGWKWQWRAKIDTKMGSKPQNLFFWTKSSLRTLENAYRYRYRWSDASWFGASPASGSANHYKIECCTPPSTVCYPYWFHDIRMLCVDGGQ